MAGGGATICVRALAALCCTLLLTTGRATSKATTTRRSGSGANGRALGNGGELGRRGSNGARSTAWANHNRGSRKPLISSLRGGGDVSPELGPYTWIPAGEGDGGSLVRLSDTGEVVAGQATPTSSDGAGKVAIASVTAAVAAVFAKFRVGRGSDPAAASGGGATPAAASQKDAEPGVASMVKKGVAAPKEAPAAGAGVNAAAKKKKAAKALKDRKTAAAERALKDKKAAAERVLKEKKSAAERAAKEKRVAVSQATMSVVQNATRKSTGVSPSWPMFSAFLYFLAMAFTIPVLPKVVNELITGSNAVTAASATLYGLLSSTDASFTLLTVKFHASMSDKYGRRPFLALSALGLGLGFYLTYHSRRVWMLLLASAIDGCTSCMYRQANMAQACITDCVGTGAGLGEAFGLFQGLSLGMAFMIGLPMGGVLGAKYGVRFPLLVSVGLCLVNFVMIAFVMPETLPDEKRVKKVDLKQANPLGAVTMATRNQLITGVFACWTLLWIAHVGLQINWINVSPAVF
ncbi:unnamed protein product, partial [Ectocarpus sp. 12 AP-2014]